MECHEMKQKQKLNRNLKSQPCILTPSWVEQSSTRALLPLTDLLFTTTVHNNWKQQWIARHGVVRRRCSIDNLLSRLCASGKMLPATCIFSGLFLTPYHFDDLSSIYSFVKATALRTVSQTPSPTVPNSRSRIYRMCSSRSSCSSSNFHCIQTLILEWFAFLFPCTCTFFKLPVLLSSPSLFRPCRMPTSKRSSQSTRATSLKFSSCSRSFGTACPLMTLSIQTNQSLQSWRLPRETSSVTAAAVTAAATTTTTTLVGTGAASCTTKPFLPCHLQLLLLRPRVVL